MCLNNFWQWSGGMSQYVSWVEGSTIPYSTTDWTVGANYAAKFYTNKRAQQMYNDHVRFIINHVNPYTGIAYKNDPDILSWQIANEPYTMNVYNDCMKWVAEAGLYIKSLDPNHLVSSGGTDECPSGSIDYMTTHVWPQNSGWFDPKNAAATYPTALQKSLEYVQRQMDKAKQQNIPFVLEEYGMARDNEAYAANTPTTYKDKYYNDMFNKVYQSTNSGNACGALFWAWSGEGRLNPAHNYQWQAGDDWMGDPAHEPQGWYCVYDTDTSTINILRNYASKFAAMNK